MPGTDVLMVTYNRPTYTARSLPRLLETCDEQTRVWLWHNGDDEETLAVVRQHAGHPAVHRLHHSRENVRLRKPTNWMLSESSGDYVSKVDDDGLMPDGWLEALRGAHEANANLGIVGTWRFRPEDFVPELAERKIRDLEGGYRLLANCWVEGSGYLMKRECVRQNGPIRDGESFTRYCIRVALKGWKTGWLYPFVCQEDMDDPRHPASLKKTEEDFLRHASLSQRRYGVSSLEECIRRQGQCAREVLEADPDPRLYAGWRATFRRLQGRLQPGRRVARFDA